MSHFLHQVFSWYGDHLHTVDGVSGWPPLLVDHVILVLIAVGISLVVAMPLGLWLGHTGRGGFAAINVTNVGRALPALAILVLAAQALGIGRPPALVALVLLSIPPILTNTYTGLRQVDADIKDAARGMGMTGVQVLFRVEVPSAISLIFAGLRTATVQAVATATLAGYVAVNCLGTLINLAINTGDHVELFAAALLVVALALATEYLLAALQRLVTPAGIKLSDPNQTRRRARVAASPIVDVA